MTSFGEKKKKEKITVTMIIVCTVYGLRVDRDRFSLNVSH